MRFRDDAEYQEFLRGRKVADTMRDTMRKHVQGAEPVKTEKPRKTSSIGPNKTEAAYGRVLAMEFPGARIRYEALTLQLDNGHAYSPDWIVTLSTGEILCVEVKNGAYKHASYGRSRMAFHQAKIDWPMLQFRWAELYQGTWKTE